MISDMNMKSCHSVILSKCDRYIPHCPRHTHQAPKAHLKWMGDFLTGLLYAIP